MAVPASVSIAAALLGDDFGGCLRKLVGLTLAAILVLVLVAVVALSAVIALVRGGFDTVQRSQLVATGGAISTAPPNVAVAEVPVDQLGALASGRGLVSDWWQLPALNQFDRRYYASDR